MTSYAPRTLLLLPAVELFFSVIVQLLLPLSVSSRAEFLQLMARAIPRTLVDLPASTTPDDESEVSTVIVTPPGNARWLFVAHDSKSTSVDAMTWLAAGVKFLPHEDCAAKSSDAVYRPPSSGIPMQMNAKRVAKVRKTEPARPFWLFHIRSIAPSDRKNSRNTTYMPRSDSAVYQPVMNCDMPSSTEGVSGVVSNHLLNDELTLLTPAMNHANGLSVFRIEITMAKKESAANAAV